MAGRRVGRIERRSFEVVLGDVDDRVGVQHFVLPRVSILWKMELVE